MCHRAGLTHSCWSEACQVTVKVILAEEAKRGTMASPEAAAGSHRRCALRSGVLHRRWIDVSTFTPQPSPSGVEPIQS
jgi:hypothetical protein